MWYELCDKHHWELTGNIYIYIYKMRAWEQNTRSINNHYGSGPLRATLLLITDNLDLLKAPTRPETMEKHRRRYLGTSVLHWWCSLEITDTHTHGGETLRSLSVYWEIEIYLCVHHYWKIKQRFVPLDNNQTFKKVIAALINEHFEGVYLWCGLGTPQSHLSLLSLDILKI